MKLYKKREKVSTGITSIATGSKRVFVGSVDDGFKILDSDYTTAKRLKINLGTIDTKYRNNSRIIRVGD
jgi:hypothetical protein